MLNKFFVYGTLRPGEARWNAISSLAAEPEPAVLYGARLYTTGAWPFIVLDGQTTSEVQGELITVDPLNVSAVLAMLDSIEGYDEKALDKYNLFVRVIQQVYVPEGYPLEDGYVKAYMYVGGHDLARDAASGRFKQLVHGDWKKRND